MLTLTDARTALSTTSGLAEIVHPYQGGSHDFVYEPGADDGAGVVALILGGERYPLSNEAALSAVLRLPGASQALFERWPIHLVIDALNFFWDNREGDFKALVDGEGNLRQFTKPTALLFDPLVILDAMADAVGTYGGKEHVIVTDFSHGLDETHFSVTVNPGQSERFVDAREGDRTLGGLYFTGSLLGKGRTELAVYTHRVLCANGMVSPAGSTRFRMGGAGGDDDAEGPLDRMVEWLHTSCEHLLGGPTDDEFERLTHLTTHPVDDAHLATTMADLFERFSLPATARTAIHEALVEEADGTMYGIVQAMTRAAQHSLSVTDGQRYALMRTAGEVAVHAQTTCESCQRPMPL